MKEKDLNIHFFWKVSQSFGYLSQWWMSDFKIDGQKYNCCEQYMMAEKARLFDDEKILKEIMECTDPNKIKDLGREIHNFNSNVWDEKCFEIVKKGNYAKFSQNKKLKEFLLTKTNDILVEASEFDKIWGIGMSKENPYINDPNNWKGKNLLGFALMEVKEKLLEE